MEHLPSSTENITGNIPGATPVVVTVVIPVFNGEQYLVDAIESVLAQTFRDFEILIVDDGSTDGTWAIIEQYLAAHPTRIRGIRKQNGGAATALNAGVLGAKGRYFAWLSHDDRFVPNKLELQLSFLAEHPEMVGVYSDYAYINETGENVGIVYSVYYPPQRMMRHLLQSVFINGSTLLVECRCLKEVGLFDEKVRYANDALMWMHLTHRYQLGYIPLPLTDYRRHPNQTTYQAVDVRNDYRIWLRRAVSDFPLEAIFPELNRPHLLPQDTAAARVYLGDALARYMQLQLSLEQYWKAWRAWPHRHNPAPRKIFRALKKIGRHRLGQLLKRGLNRRNVYIHVNSPIVVDLRNYSEDLPDVRFTFDQ